MTPLEAEIRSIIAEEGPISVARYMALCLSHPAHGYYTTRDPIGARGDFVTAPEISQMFGELIGLWAVATWELMGAPHPLRLVELGPGRGTLMADVLRAAAVLPDFVRALRVHLIETSPTLRRQQDDVLNGRGVTVRWHGDFSEVPEGPLIVVANEFFDALPVHQAVKAPDGWHERLIGVDEAGRLAFAVHREPVRGLDGMLPPHVRAAPIGSLYEWRSGHVARELGERLQRDGGAALIIDYGHIASDVGQTLQAVAQHGLADPLTQPGRIDITAHVDFAAIVRAAQPSGARAHGPVAQGDFLRRLGIAERAGKLKERATPAQISDIDNALARLTATGPTGMGEMFKVLGLAHSTLSPLPGFGN
jgi:SAM-dependent MidA family methyltransferase